MVLRLGPYFTKFLFKRVQLGFEYEKEVQGAARRKNDNPLSPARLSGPGSSAPYNWNKALLTISIDEETLFTKLASWYLSPLLPHQRKHDMLSTTGLKMKYFQLNQHVNIPHEWKIWNTQTQVGTDYTGAFGFETNAL